MRFAYADPPYLGCGKLYAAHHPDALKWDRLEAHVDLMAECDDAYEAWALSLSSPSLREILPHAPEGVRVAAWVKPFASFKRGVDPAYTWEPVIFRSARKWDRGQPTCRDHLVENIALKKGLAGAKPDGFWFWLFDLLGASPGDDFVDFFAGTGRGDSAWAEWQARYTGAAIDGQESLALTTATREEG